MSYKTDLQPLLEKIFGTKELYPQIDAFIETRDGKTDEFEEYLKSVGYDVEPYNEIREAFDAGLPDDSEDIRKYGAEYCMKYLINHSRYGKEKDKPASANDLNKYVLRRLEKNKYIPTAD